MPRTPVRVFPTPDAIGEHLAGQLLGRIESARQGGKTFVLGCPTGRTPRPVYDAMARRLAEKPQDLSHLTLAMMDDYLVAHGGGFDSASRQALVSRASPASRAWTVNGAEPEERCA